MLDSVRIKAADEQTAVTLVHDLEFRFRAKLVHEPELGWEVRVESESEDDLPDLLEVLNERLRTEHPSIEVLIDGEAYTGRQPD